MAGGICIGSDTVGVCRDICGFDGSATAGCPAGEACTPYANLFANGDEDPVAGACTAAANFPFTGFLQPVDNPPTVNVVKAGSAIPVQFSLGGDQGLGIFAFGFPVSQQVACGSSDPVSDIEETFTAGHSSLSYDPTLDQYTYVWKTERTWEGTCRQLVVGLLDGSSYTAVFLFK